VGNPKELRKIARAKAKTDVRDSRKLAHLLSMGYLPEVYKRSAGNPSSLRVTSEGVLHGEADVSKHWLRALLAQQGEEVREEVGRVEDLFTAKGIRVIEGLALPEREAKRAGALLIPIVT